MNKEKRFPTIIGLIFLIISILVGVFLTGNRTIFRSKASATCNPLNYQVTNITNKSVDISFTTSTECSTAVLIDNRTFANLKGLSKIHYFEIDNLKENTEYNFSFLNGGTTFSEDRYKFKTAQTPKTSIPSANLAWGRILNPDLKPATEAIIYLVIPGASPLSSFVTSNGNWNISLASSFNEAKTDWFVPPENINEDIIVISPDQATQISGNTSLNNPVPDITIGKNSLNPQQISVTPTKAVSLVVPTSSPVTIKTTVQSPTENETISALRPDFFGTAPSNSQVLVKIDSITGNATSNNSGIWHWSPSQDLSVGKHTLLITNEVSNESISRTFTILPQSNSLAFSATPSAILNTPTPVPTLIPTLVPTIRTAKPSTRSGVPVTGTAFPTFLSLAAAIIFTFGSFLFFKK